MYEFVIGEYAFYMGARGARKDFGPEWKEDFFFVGRISAAQWEALKPHCEKTTNGYRIHLDNLPA